MFWKLESPVDRLEPKNYVYSLELSVSVKENLELQNSVKICKVHLVTIRGSVRLVCKKKRVS